MSLAKDGANALIASFGETVTVVPQASDTPEDSKTVFFEQSSSSESSFDEKVRLYTTPSDETLRKYGFEEDTEGMIYNTEDNIDEGDLIQHHSREYVVTNKATNQIGNGPYLFIYELKGN